MTVNLILPMMMRILDLEINECPKFLSKNPSESDYSIYFPDANLRIPMTIEGIISYIPTRIQSKDKLERYSGEYLLLTPNLPDWNSHTHLHALCICAWISLRDNDHNPNQAESHSIDYLSNFACTRLYFFRVLIRSCALVLLVSLIPKSSTHNTKAILLVLCFHRPAVCLQGT